MGLPMDRPVCASHSRAVVSWLPVRTVLPSGLNVKQDCDVTRMPHGSWPMGCPVSRRPTVGRTFSVPAVRIVLPSGLFDATDGNSNHPSDRPIEKLSFF